MINKTAIQETDFCKKNLVELLQVKASDPNIPENRF